MADLTGVIRQRCHLERRGSVGDAQHAALGVEDRWRGELCAVGLAVGVVGAGFEVGAPVDDPFGLQLDRFGGDRVDASRHSGDMWVRVHHAR